MTRTKTLTPEEYAGIPKGERNSPTPYIYLINQK